MKLDIRIISVHGGSGDGSSVRDVPDGTSVTSLIELLNLPTEAVYAVMINDLPIGIDERDARVLQSNDKVTIFPPIQGG